MKIADIAFAYNVKPSEVVDRFEDIGAETKVCLDVTRVIPGEIEIEKFDKLAKIIGLQADFKEMNFLYRDHIVYWAGSLIDRDLDESEYERLKDVGGDVFSMDTDLFTADLLETIGGSLRIGGVELTLRGLRVINRDLLYEGSGAVNLPVLELVGEFEASKAISCSAPLLQSSFDIKVPKATAVNFDSLQLANGDVIVSAAESVYLPILKGCLSLGAESAKVLDAPELRNCPGIIYAISAESINLPQLEDVQLLVVGKQIDFARINVTDKVRAKIVVSETLEIPLVPLD